MIKSGMSYGKIPVCYRSFWLLAGAVILLGNASYWLLVREGLLLWLTQPSQPSAWDMLYQLYPRLAVEKQRFSPHFFIEKADQLVLRADAAFIFFGVLWFLFRRNTGFTRFFQRIGQQKLGHAAVFWVSLLIYGGAIAFTKDWPQYLASYYHAAAFYRPVTFMHLFAYPPPWLSTSLYWCMCACALSMLWGGFRLWASIIFAVLFLLLLGWQQSFEKISHTYAVYSYVLMLMPLLYRNRSQPVFWPLWLIRLAICTGYFFSGLEKVTVSGWYWLDGSALEHYLKVFPTEWGGFLVLNKELLGVFAVFPILLQLTFPVVCFRKKWVPYYVVLGVLFHFFTVILLKVGAFVNPWIYLYICFIPWERGGWPNANVSIIKGKIYGWLSRK